MLYSFFWVIPRRLNFLCRRFGTLCSIFIGRWWRWNRVPKRRQGKFRRRLSPTRKNTTYTTRRKYDSKNFYRISSIISWVDFNLTSLLKGAGLQATENMSLRTLLKIMSVPCDTGKAEALVLQTIHTYCTQLSASQHQMKDDGFVTSSITKAFDTIQGTIPVKFRSRTKYFILWLLHNQFVLGK